jgi:hypothetical protein
MEDPMTDPTFQFCGCVSEPVVIKELPLFPTPEQLADVLGALKRESGADGVDAPFLKFGGRIYGQVGLDLAATRAPKEKMLKGRLYAPNIRNANPELKHALKDRQVTIRIDQLRQIMDMAVRYDALLSNACEIEVYFKEKEISADHILAGIRAFIKVIDKTLPNSPGTTTRMPPPSYLMTLRGEICNLSNGVASPSFSLDSVSLGDNPRSPRRLLWQAQAAGLLRLFMERDGVGTQKTAAGKIAKALAAGGVLKPGPRRKPYTRRTVIGWMRDAEQGEAAFTEDYRFFLSRMRTMPELKSLGLEHFVKMLTAFLKHQIFEPRRV